MSEKDTPMFRIDEQAGERPFKILDQAGNIVGSSETSDKAARSIVHRVAAHKKKQEGL